VLANGLPGVVSWREDGTSLSVISFTVVVDDDGRIVPP
jgi:RNA polymerase sigma-70 factor (ECF subfamily)